MKVAPASLVSVVTAACSLLLGLALPPPAQAQYSWTNFAGKSGGSGIFDGAGSAARFNASQGVATDTAGNLYVADTANHLIRKVTPAGVVSTVAGAPGVAGSADGPGSTARFNLPEGIASDAAGNLYVADTANHTIRKVTPAGVVSTVAGLAGSASGFVDGNGSAARFFLPRGIASDAAGNLSVADSDAGVSGRIRKVTPAGVVTTLSNSGGSAVQVNRPQGIAVDAAGNFYVTANETVQKVTPAGVVSTLAGAAGIAGSADGTGSAARFTSPEGITLDAAGNLYVADASNCTVRKVTPAGVVTTVAGLAGNVGVADGTGSAARFRFPRGIAADAAGNLSVADTGNHTIRKIAPGSVVTTLAGSTDGGAGVADGVGSTARFNAPQGLVLDASGNVYVADSMNHAIRRVTSAGVVTTVAGSTGNPGSANGTGSAARFDTPQGIALDAGGSLLVSEFVNNTIRVVTPAGAVSTLAGVAGVGGSADGTGAAAKFLRPQGIAFDAMGNLYVADSINHTIRKVTPGGVVTTFAGLAGSAGSADGAGSAARFNLPADIALDAAGNLFVADSGNHAIRRVTPAGVVTAFAGLAGSAGSADGAGSAARFRSPNGLANDAAGNLFVADSGNHAIRRVTPAGVVTTLGGLPGTPGDVDGVGSAARFYFPAGIAVDAAGTLFVADYFNNRISRGVPAAAAESRLINVSTRLRTDTGDNVLIAGFVVRGGPKKMVVRALGPSLTAAGVPGVLADPMLSLFNPAGQPVATNDNWQDGSSAADVRALGLSPVDARESALVVTLAEGAYTAIVRGAANGTGNCLVEVYDAEVSSAPKLINLSTRGPVGSGDNVMIAGFVIQGTQSKRVLIRSLGPSLAAAGVPNVLADPTLELFSASASLASNDNWQSSQPTEIAAAGLAPTSPLESAIVATLAPGVYTAIVRGNNNATGNALVEVYELP